MSLVGDVIAAFETMARTAIPTLPAGDLGVSRGFRIAEDVPNEACPHFLTYDPREKPTPLAFQQKRVEVSLRVVVIRKGGTHAQSLDDFNALRAALIAAPTLGGLVQQSELGLDAIEESPETGTRIAVMEFAGLTVV